MTIMNFNKGDEAIHTEHGVGKILSVCRGSSTYIFEAYNDINKPRNQAIVLDSELFIGDYVSELKVEV